MKTLVAVLLLSLSITSCRTDDLDDELPVIDMSAVNAFPTACVTVYRGESFEFKAVFTDNAELGSYSIEMHHNFDRHTHSTDGVPCDTDPVKTPVSPFQWIENYTIPSGLQRFEASNTIPIPSTVDTGLYHFMVRLTDAAGWQTFKGISVRIADR